MNKQYVFFIVFILLASFAIAVPPFKTTISDSTIGFVVENIPLTLHLEGYPLDFNIHVFNASTGLAINKDIGCYFHLYNSSGNHIYNGEDRDASTSPNGLDYEFEIGGGNFTKGLYSFIAQCNNSLQGGFTAGGFEVTDRSLIEESGRDLSTTIPIALFLFAINFGLFYMSLKAKFLKDHVSNFILNRCFLILGFFLLAMNLSIMMTFAQASAIDLDTELFTYVWIMMWSAVVASIALFFQGATRTIFLWDIRKKKRRMGEEDDD